MVVGYSIGPVELMQLADSILLPQPLLQLSYAVGAPAARRSPDHSKLANLTQPRAQCRTRRTCPPVSAQAERLKAEPQSDTGQSRHKLGRAAAIAPSAGRSSFLETRLDTLKAASQKKGLQDVLARIESRKKESDRDLHW